jgi:hypothetical protein
MLDGESGDGQVRARQDRLVRGSRVVEDANGRPAVVHGGADVRVRDLADRANLSVMVVYHLHLREDGRRHIAATLLTAE